MTLLRTSIQLYVALGAFFAFPLKVLAAYDPNKGVGKWLSGDNTPTKSFFDEWGGSFNNPGIIVARVIQIFMGFLGIICVGLITYAGFLWLTAGGEEEQAKKARNILFQSVIGLLIVMMAWSVSWFVISALNAAVYQTAR